MSLERCCQCSRACAAPPLERRAAEAFIHSTSSDAGATIARATWAAHDLQTFSRVAAEDTLSHVLTFLAAHSMSTSRPPERLHPITAVPFLDAAMEAALDQFAKLAAHVMRYPMALVSLVDQEYKWWMARYGLAEPSARDTSFCGHVEAADALSSSVTRAPMSDSRRTRWSPARRT